ncbi:MAG TPA: hypothetical protein DHW54_08985 [Gemmatimonadetes bacterium]|nr:hypothetical protein [Gemmatimonadota bacterium]|tara:strand:+ start:1495 stop:2829 length:1335 start_codon:yes stop_codon:yes gene_type:complete
MKNRIKASVLTVVTALALSGCGDLLDVNNPNNLVEESISQAAAASAVVNGSLSLVSSAISQIWQPYLVTSDEVYWIGSRDAWLALDQGFIGNPENEFSDGAFPSVGRGRWMADQAIKILQGHASGDPSFNYDLARANHFAGIMYTVIGEVMEDFAFSDKTESGAPVGPGNMSSVLNSGISYLDAAVSSYESLGNADRAVAAKAMRARAHQSRAIWDVINPTASGTFTTVNASAAAADAQAVITAAGGNSADVEYDLVYSSGSQTNSMGGWINDRKENQYSTQLVTLDANNNRTGVAMMDPIDNIVDPAVTKRMKSWGCGAADGNCGPYSPLTISSTRLMHLILAENALAGGDGATFTTHINHIRAMDGLTAFSGQISNNDMLQHTRRANTMIMGLRLADMYRFGLTDPKWEAQSDAISTPGEMLPITIIEIRANCHLNGQGCGG